MTTQRTRRQTSAPTTTVPVEDTPQDTGAWDLEAWLSDAQPLRVPVEICGRADLYARWVELEARLAQARQDPPAGRLTGSRGGVSESAIVAEMDTVREAMAESMRTLVFRAITPDEAEAIDRECPTETDDEGRTVPDATEQTLRMVALSCVSPGAMTLEQARTLRERIGGQWSKVAATVWSVTATRDVPVPFSSRYSAARERAALTQG